MPPEWAQSGIHVGQAFQPDEWPIRQAGKPDLLRRRHDESDGPGEGIEGIRGGRLARWATARRDGQVQRGAGEGGDPPGRRGAAPELEGGEDPVLGQGPDRDRRAVRRDARAPGRLLALAGEVDGGRHRVGQALPQPDEGGVRARDPPGLLARGLRAERSHGRAPRGGGEAQGRVELERYDKSFDPATGTGGIEIWVPLKA